MTRARLHSASVAAQGSPEVKHSPGLRPQSVNTVGFVQKGLLTALEEYRFKAMSLISPDSRLKQLAAPVKAAEDAKTMRAGIVKLLMSTEYAVEKYFSKKYIREQVTDDLTWQAHVAKIPALDAAMNQMAARVESYLLSLIGMSQTLANFNHLRQFDVEEIGRQNDFLQNTLINVIKDLANDYYATQVAPFNSHVMRSPGSHAALTPARQFLGNFKGIVESVRYGTGSTKTELVFVNLKQSQVDVLVKQLNVILGLEKSNKTLLEKSLSGNPFLQVKKDGYISVDYSVAKSPAGQECMDRAADLENLQKCILEQVYYKERFEKITEDLNQVLQHIDQFLAANELIKKDFAKTLAEEAEQNKIRFTEQLENLVRLQGEAHLQLKRMAALEARRKEIATVKENQSSTELSVLIDEMDLLEEKAFAANKSVDDCGSVFTEGFLRLKKMEQQAIERYYEGSVYEFCAKKADEQHTRMLKWKDDKTQAARAVILKNCAETAALLREKQEAAKVKERFFNAQAQSLYDIERKLQSLDVKNAEFRKSRQAVIDSIQSEAPEYSRVLSSKMIDVLRETKEAAVFAADIQQDCNAAAVAISAVSVAINACEYKDAGQTLQPALDKIKATFAAEEKKSAENTELLKQLEEPTRLLEEKIAAAKEKERVLAKKIRQILIAAIMNNLPIWHSHVSNWLSWSHINGTTVPGSVAEALGTLLQEGKTDFEILDELCAHAKARSELLTTNWRYKVGMRQAATTELLAILSGLNSKGYLTDTNVARLEQRLKTLNLTLNVQSEEKSAAVPARPVVHVRHVR